MAQDPFYTEDDCGDLVLGGHMSGGADERQTKQLWQHARLGSANGAPKRKPTLAFFSSKCFRLMPFADDLRIARSFGKLAQPLFA